MPTFALRARGLTAGYDDRTVLAGIDLSVAEHRTCVITGPGGSGKSTLLRVLAGEAAADAPWSHGALERAGGVVHLPQRRVADPASLRRFFEAPDAERRVREFWSAAPEAAGALVHASREPRPAGWTLRLAEFTRVAAEGDAALLLDEPEVGLNEAARGWLEARVRAWHGARTVVLVTHHLGLARAVADDVVLLVDGAVIEAAPAADFFERPARERTREFVRMGA